MTKKKLSGKSPSGSKTRPAKRSLGREIVAGRKELQAHMRGRVKLSTRMIDVPDAVNIRAIRERSGLSQSEFAGRYGFSLRTLQEWEQGRARPDNAVRAYLIVIDRDPGAVEKALVQGAA